ncbi:MAG TPA: LuxR C-terminal-related transcriptional regulator, partial [Fluviicoccus sp.]|nr:LuxR C-terminal-related transcriptional regulator [Fluviicoccus sp.]
MAPFTLPLQHGGLLRRDALLDHLDKSLELPLTLLAAPAGYGKTVLLRQWLDRQSTALTVSLSLAKGDAGLPGLYRQLLHALHGRDAGPSGPISGDAGPDVWAAAWLTALGSLRRPLVMAFDDFPHTTESPALLRFLTGLLNDLPDAVHLIIAARRMPGLPVSRLRLADRLLLVGEAELRLSEQELPAFCAALGVPPPLPDRAAALMQWTEGWPVGLKLALLSPELPGRSVPETLQDSRSGLDAYFADSVLETLPPPERELLMATAVPEHFDAAMAACLAGADAGERLPVLLDSGSFVQAADDRPGHYRYHPLFRNFLLAEGRRASPERLAALHMAAAEQRLAEGAAEAALAHARAAGGGAVHFPALRRMAAQWLRQGRLQALTDLLDSVAPAALHDDPALFMPRLAALIFTRRFEQARCELDDIARRHHGRVWPEPVPAQLRAAEKLLALFQDDEDPWSDAELFGEPDGPHGDLRDAIGVLAARHHLLAGHCARALALAKEARVLMRRQGNAYLEGYAESLVIMAEREQGNILAAHGLIERFFERHAQQPDSPCGVMAGTSRVVSLYEQNRLDEARVLCQALLPRVSTACSTFMVFHVYLTAARLHARAGETGAGRRLLRQLRFLLQQGKYGRMLNQLLAEELAFALHGDNKAALRGIALDYGLQAALDAGEWRAARTGYHERWVFGGIAAAHFLRGEDRLDEALAVLGVVAESLQPGEMKARQITVETNRLVILSLLGRNAEALRGVAELYERVHLQCVIRTVLDDAPGFARLLWLAHRERLIRLPDFYLQLYADLFEGFIREQPDIPGPEPLTGKEREVLMLVRRGLSNKDMSREMGVSLSTVKWH